MGNHDFIYDEDIKRNIKWKKLYGKTKKQLIYEGHTLNNKPCGKGTTYYSNGTKHLEGTFYIKGLYEGREYYHNGKLRFEGKCHEHSGYGPNYPIEGKYYDLDGKLIYSGKFESLRQGNLRWPKIVNPEGFGHIRSEDTGLEFLKCNDIEKVKEEEKKKRVTDESKYPITYNQFKERILKVFVDESWDYHRQFTKEEKEEFIASQELDFRESYQEECSNYDNGFLNVFDKPEDVKKYIMGLLFECDMYHALKKSNKKTAETTKIDESKYPMTYHQFKQKMIELLMMDAGKISNVKPEDVPGDVEEFLKEQPSYFKDIYRQCCEDYDKSHNKKVFSDETLSVKYVWYWGMWMDYWFFM